MHTQAHSLMRAQASLLRTLILPPSQQSLAASVSLFCSAGFKNVRKKRASYGSKPSGFASARQRLCAGTEEKTGGKAGSRGFQVKAAKSGTLAMGQQVADRKGGRGDLLCGKDVLPSS